MVGTWIVLVMLSGSDSGSLPMPRFKLDSEDRKTTRNTTSELGYDSKFRWSMAHYAVKAGISMNNAETDPLIGASWCGFPFPKQSWGGLSMVSACAGSEWVVGSDLLGDVGVFVGYGRPNPRLWARFDTGASSLWSRTDEGWEWLPVTAKAAFRVGYGQWSGFVRAYVTSRRIAVNGQYYGFGLEFRGKGK